MDKHWKKYQGALLWNGDPKKEIPTIDNAKEALKKVVLCLLVGQAIGIAKHQPNGGIA